MLLNNITFVCLDKPMHIDVMYDKKYTRNTPVHGIKEGRVYLQAYYYAKCTDTKEEKFFSGGKHYLSEYMTDDEIVKRAFVVFRDAVTHEVMEGFKFNNIKVFNPHVNYLELMKISNKEIKREQL